MNRQWFVSIVQAAVITLTLAAICQELEKPKEERTWHGKIARIFPYDFRLPIGKRLREAYWNPYGRILTPTVFGVGWAINFYALLEKLGIMEVDVSEESFLMPSQSIKEVLKEAKEGE